MLLDALTNMSLNQDLTLAAAGVPAVSNVIDLSQDRDIANSNVPVLVVFGTLPAGPAGATINAALQTSVDGVTFTTLEETSPQPIANFTSANTFLFRGTVPAGGHRFMQMAYTVSAALTAGLVTASIGADWPHNRAYPRNYVA